MRFVSLRGENFKSFKKLSVDLDGCGFVKIDGVNNTDNCSMSVGSGKSSIADMISYALTGETVKGNSSISDVKNMYTDGVCRVEVVFEHTGKTYKIVRGENELSISEDGVDISKHLKRETQELIMSKFPFFTPTFLGATVIIGQNMPNAFTNNKPSARKQILEELTNSSFMIEEIKDMLATRKSDWQADIGDLNTKIVVENSKIDSSMRVMERARQRMSSLKSVDDLNSEIERLSTASAEVVEALNSEKSLYEEAIRSRDALISKRSEVSSELDKARIRHSEYIVSSLSSLTEKKSNIEGKISELQGEHSLIMNEIKRLNSQIREIESTPTVCPTCGQPLPNAKKIDTSKQKSDLLLLNDNLGIVERDRDKLLSEKRSRGAEISEFKQRNSTSTDIEHLKSVISDLDLSISAKSSDISQFQRSVDKHESDLSSYEKSISALRVQLGEVESVRRNCEDDIKTAQSDIAASEEVVKDLSDKIEVKQGKLSKLNQVISFATRDFRTILLSNIIKRLDAYAKAYCNKILNTSDIWFRDDGNNIAISYLGRDFSVLSGGESQVVKMCITLALKKTLEDLVGFTTNIMFFDEILDNCDKSTAQQLIELVSDLGLSSTFFISHHDDVFLPVDRTWTVTKTDKISELSI